MIIKGGSRAGPQQLARHLLRRDTNERVDILELQSPISDLYETLRDWQVISEGTRGIKGLYHVNIDPATKYKMTEEQWHRCVDVLEKELGFEGQPRAVVMHEKHGRQHIHVVWARTDIDTMTLRSDSQNYLAHERASQALEREFGHEMVPGKHAKRDRDRQPDFPRAKMTQAEQQQGERTGLDPARRKDQITALMRVSDSAPAFRQALEDSGYLLAKGDKRTFVIVDTEGEVYSLSRQIRGMKPADFRTFMDKIDREKLPTADEAKVRAEEQRRAEERKRDNLKKEQDQKAAEIEKIRKDVADRHARELQKFTAYHAQQLKTEEFRAEERKKQALGEYAGRQILEMQKLKQQLREEVTGIKAVIDALQRRWNPTVAAEKTQQRRDQVAQLKSRQQQELEDHRVLLEQNMKMELDALRERQGAQLRELSKKTEQELTRYIGEFERAEKIRQEMQQGKTREQDRKRDGPDPPSRAR